MTEIIEFPKDAAVPAGLFALAGLPQRGSVAQQAFGVGWPELDSILKFYLGQFIVVTGIPGHGKSTFMLNVLLKLALERRVGSFLYVPENEGHLREKLRMIWPGDQASFDYFCREQCIVQSARLDQSQDIEFVLQRAAWAVDNCKTEIVFIDPWNELDRARGRDETMTDYIGRCLIRVKDFCRTRNAIVVIVAHPTKVVTQNGGRVVGLADIEGSMNWFNKCDNGLIVVRDSATNTAKVISAKVREIGAGKVGSCSFTVDPSTGKFTPQYGSDFDV
jgi:twinkle protein